MTRAKGRKPGYKHSKETKNKISVSHTGQVQDPSTKKKISESMSGKSKSVAHRAALSESLLGLEQKCLDRFISIRSEYPGFEEFFDKNKVKLLQAMRDVRSEKELRDIRKYIETTPIEAVPEECIKYQYSSSSIFAQEDLVIELLDSVHLLKKFVSAENAVSH